MVLTRYQTSKTAEAESAGLVNLDFRKAFDSVHHDFVLLVLRQVGLEPKATNFFDGNNHKTKSKSKKGNTLFIGYTTFSVTKVQRIRKQMKHFINI